MSYLEKRGHHSTGWWYGEYKHKTAGRFRARFKTKDEADAYEAHVRAFGQEPDWAHTADLEELKGTVEKLSDDLRAAEERIKQLEEELSLTRRDIAALTPPEVGELKEWQALRDTFKAPDRAAAQPKGDDRRKTERLYRIHPSWPPLLLGEDFRKRKNPNPRSPIELAEAVLRDLNFQKDVSDKVVTYKLCNERFIVLADPREEGWLRFFVYEETTHSRERPTKRRTFRTERFGVSPRLERDIPAEFRRRLSQACRVLVARAEAARNPGRH